MDKNHLIYGISGEHEIAEGWTLSGELELEKGSSDQNLTAVIKILRVW